VESLPSAGQAAYVQQFIYLLGIWSFDLRGVTQALSHKTTVPSP